jgi:hypothetical protein
MNGDHKCNHDNVITNDDGMSTCADCFIYFNKSFGKEFTKYHNISKVSKSDIVIRLELEGIYDINIHKLTEKIFILTSKNKMLKGLNKQSILFASLYYACCYLGKPKNFKELVLKFKLNKKQASKGLKLCQIAIQESNNFDDGFNLKSQYAFFSSSYKENLEELIIKYNIPINFYDEIEQILIAGHLKKNKTLNNKITTLWISCIFFWLLKINPHIEPEEFISINNDHNITLTQLRSQLIYLDKNI